MVILLSESLRIESHMVNEIEFFIWKIEKYRNENLKHEALNDVPDSLIEASMNEK
jgi:hypothetical protein